MNETTELKNAQNRIEHLESLLKQLYFYLKSGKKICPFSEAHHDIGVCIGEENPNPSTE